MSPEHTQPERFHGFHGERIVFIVDEASGVPEAHWEAIKGSALAGKAVILAIGNPTRLRGVFYEAFHRQAALWRRLHISAFDTPNLQTSPAAQGPHPPGQARPAIAGLVTPEGVEQARLDWGEESPLWQVRIMGQFPTQASNGLLDLEWIEEATRREREGSEASLGVDVARSGQDETALCLMIGNRVERLETWRGQDTMKTAGAVKLYAMDYAEISIAIDDGGVGGGVVDRLREMNVGVHAVKFGAAPEGRQAVHFKNRLAELYWQVREELREGRIGIPNDARLLAQLTQLEWEQESDARIRVHKRGMGKEGESPDRADALALAVEARRRGRRGPGVWLF